jgi:hypothetical protein
MLRTILAPLSELWEDGGTKNWYDSMTGLSQELNEQFQKPLESRGSTQAMQGSVE